MVVLTVPPGTSPVHRLLLLSVTWNVLVQNSHTKSLQRLDRFDCRSCTLSKRRLKYLITHCSNFPGGNFSMNMGEVYNLRGEFRTGLNCTPSSHSNGNLPLSPGTCWEERWVGAQILLQNQMPQVRQGPGSGRLRARPLQVPGKPGSSLRAEWGPAANRVTSGGCRKGFVTVLSCSPQGLRARLLTAHSRSFERNLWRLVCKPTTFNPLPSLT